MGHRYLESHDRLHPGLSRVRQLLHDGPVASAARDGRSRLRGRGGPTGLSPGAPRGPPALGAAPAHLRGQHERPVPSGVLLGPDCPGLQRHGRGPLAHLPGPDQAPRPDGLLRRACLAPAWRTLDAERSHRGQPVARDCLAVERLGRDQRGVPEVRAAPGRARQGPGAGAVRVCRAFTICFGFVKMARNPTWR